MVVLDILLKIILFCIVLGSIAILVLLHFIIKLYPRIKESDKK